LSKGKTSAEVDLHVEMAAIAGAKKDQIRPKKSPL
jgi:hypothetical protein